jgi:Uma2 family endonuclease
MAIAPNLSSLPLTILPLENGDRLTRPEFERRYQAMSQVKKAELNEPQPDAVLRIEVGGQSSISADDYIVGAPELIVEVAASSAAYDLHQKLNAYRRNQVQEYLVWRVCDRQFDWFKLDRGNYIQLAPNSDKITCSQIFPGLWLDKESLLSWN